MNFTEMIRHVNDGGVAIRVTDKKEIIKNDEGDIVLVSNAAVAEWRLETSDFTLNAEYEPKREEIGMSEALRRLKADLPVFLHDGHSYIGIELFDDTNYDAVLNQTYYK